MFQYMIFHVFEGTVPQVFLLQVLSLIIFPQAPENNIRVLSNFFGNSWRYSQVKVHHQYQRHRYQWHRRQILPLVLLIPAANLSPVSTPVAKNGSIFRRHLQVNLKEKLHLYVNSTTQRCPNKIIKTVLIEDFSICHAGAIDISGAPWTENISANFWENSKRT